MTQEEKELLIRDLMARICYKVCARQYYTAFGDDFIIEGIIGEQIYARYNLKISMTYPVEKIKPYLRSMSTMTDEEREEYRALGGVMSYNSEHNTWAICAFTPEAYDWLNKKQFDYRGLISMGLALEAPEDMYNTKNK